MNQQHTVSSLMATAATGAAWPLSCLTKTSSFKSHIIQVRSRDPLTMMLYAAEAARQVTASLWPNRDFFKDRRRRWRPLPNSHTFTTWKVKKILEFQSGNFRKFIVTFLEISWNFWKWPVLNFWKINNPTQHYLSVYTTCHTRTSHTITYV